MNGKRLTVKQHGTSFGITDGTHWAPIAYVQHNAAELVLRRCAATLAVVHPHPVRVIDLNSL